MLRLYKSFCALILILFLILTMNSCSTLCKESKQSGEKSTNEAVRQADLTLLASLMTGSFSSQKQSIDDREFFDIRLQMVRIWPSRTDGYWLYIEQAVASHLDKPYRQRVYHVTLGDGDTYRSAVFAFDEPLRFAGAYKEKEPLSALTPADLHERQGCVIILKKIADKSFSGSTVDRECESSLRGATYATSQVTISPTELYSWDRGFDSQGKQVWGAVKEGYHFLKLEDYSL